jgi:hypothetical protein
MGFNLVQNVALKFLQYFFYNMLIKSIILVAVCWNRLCGTCNSNNWGAASWNAKCLWSASDIGQINWGACSCTICSHTRCDHRHCFICIRLLLTKNVYTST